MSESHILAIGGHDFRDPEFRPLDDHLLELTRKKHPRVLFVGTASKEDPSHAEAFHAALGARAETAQLELFPWPPEGLRELVLEQDAVFVGGGNTANMLALWRVHGVDLLLREAWTRGVVLAGGSAGMICWFECSVTDSFGPELAPLRDGLGLLPGSACPHYDRDGRRPVYEALVRDGLAAGYAADGVGLHFTGTELADVVTCRKGARAYRVEPEGEVVLEARLLG